MRWITSVPNAFPVGWHLGAHSHPAVHELVLVRDGQLATRMIGRTFIARAGTLMLHPAGVEHEESTLGGRELATWYLAWPTQSADELAGLELQVSDRNGRIETGLRWLSEVIAQGSSASQHAAQGLLCALLHEVRQSAILPEERMVAAVRAHALARLSTPLRLSDLARIAGMSSAHFSRSFQATAGSSPMRYLRQLRMQRAQHLLLTTDLSVMAVAAQVGFPDPLHFSRVFRQCTGQAPQRLRRSRDT
jgi:AraC-like DNA-binding protein